MSKRVNRWVRWAGMAGCLSVLLSAIPIPTAQGLIRPTGVLPPVPDRFHSYASLLAELLEVTRVHPEVAHLVVLGESWETTEGLANRSVFALGLRTDGEPKKPILFMGLYHGNEWMSMEVVMYILRYFLANLQGDPRVDAILERADVWFIPVVNPDGLEYTRLYDSTWRKNRRDNGDGTFGVDLNRNYGYMWASSDVGAEPGSSDYRGPAAFSEPETRAIRNFALARPPVLSISYHTAGRWILYPWSYTRQPTPDDDLFRAYAQGMAEANGYRVLQEGRSDSLKPGNSDDWLYASLRTLAFTFEVGLDFGSQNVTRIRPVVQNNIEPALRGAEMVLHLRPVGGSWPQITSPGFVALIVSATAGSIFFLHRRFRPRRTRERDTPRGPAVRP